MTGSAVLDPDGDRHAARPLGEPAVTVATADRVLPTAADKAALFAATGAAVVDMEAAGVARACEAAGVAFAAVKVVTDAAGDDLPAGLGPFLDFAAAGGGFVNAARCAWALSRRPRLARELWRLSRVSSVCGMNWASHLREHLPPPAG